MNVGAELYLPGLQWRSEGDLYEKQKRQLLRQPLPLSASLHLDLDCLVEVSEFLSDPDKENSNSEALYDPFKRGQAKTRRAQCG